MIKLIVTDMDGTLLNEKGQIPKSFWPLEKKLQEQGVLFCVASGRQYFNLEILFQEIKNNTIFLAENGSLVIFRDQIIAENKMEKDALQEWLEITRPLQNVQMVFCGRNGAYIEKPKNETILQEIKKYYSKLTIVDSLIHVEDSLLKIAICDFGGSETNTYHLFKKFENKYQVIVSGNMWLDLMNLTTNKGDALEKIKEHFQIKDDELLIFGDYLNDYEMMFCGEYTFAMENGHPLLKEKAKYTIKSNKEEGVIHTIQKILNL